MSSWGLWGLGGVASHEHTPSSTPFIARGLKIDHPEDDHDLFQAIHERRATPDQLLKLVGGTSGRVGEWWGTYGGEHGEHDPEGTAYGRLEDFRGHSGDELNADWSVDGTIQNGYHEPGGPITATVPVVLVGRRPERGGEPWDPEVHNEANGLMGNSYLEDGEEVPLHEIHYHTGTDWVRVRMPRGVTVKANTDGVRYARVVEADVAEDLRRFAMPWPDWADKIQHIAPDGGIGLYYVNHDGGRREQSQLAYSLSPDSRRVNVHGLYTNEDHRNDGLAEAMIRRLHEDHPDYRINPGGMTDDGQAFHDRMLTKEPGAKDFLAALAVTAAADEYHQIDEWGNHARDGHWDYADPNVDLHMNGECREWALYHQRMNPHLRIGVEWVRVPPEERDDPDDEWDLAHAFTHDDHWAYDARGAFPLSEWRKWMGWDDVTLNHDNRIIGGRDGYPRGDGGITEEMAARAGTKPPPQSPPPSIAKGDDGYWRIASTDGVRYAHVVEADVADDLRRTASDPRERSLDELAQAGYVTDGWREWQQGGCIEYAHALKQRHPHLQVGVISTPGDEDDWRHIFVHDGTHAYDSAGRHPLPYTGVHGDLEQHLDHDLDWYDDPDPDLVELAHQHIDKHGIGPRTAHRTAARDLDGIEFGLTPGEHGGSIPQPHNRHEGPTHRHAAPRRKWYHASPHRLEPGTVLTPGGGKSPWQENLYDRHPGEFDDRSEHVWVDTDPLIWAGADTPYVYEVRPHHPPKRWHIDPEDGYTTPAATITRMISDDGGDTWLDEPKLSHRTAMPAPLPEGITFHYYSPEREGCSSCEADCPASPHLHPRIVPPAVQAVDKDGRWVGHLNIDTEDDWDDWDQDPERDGPVGQYEAPAMIAVSLDHRRQSVATGMFDFAKRFHPGLTHSKDKTPEGQAWADYEENRPWTHGRDGWRPPQIERTAMPLPMPEGITFHHHGENDEFPQWMRNLGLGLEAPAVEARHDGRPVGFLSWNYERQPEPAMVHVHPDYRRHGIATALWDFARQHEPDLQHSQDRTDLGDHWVRHEQSRNARIAMPLPMPEGVTFHHHPTNDTIPTEPWVHDPKVQAPLFSAPAVEARHHGKTVGYLEWDPPLHAHEVNGIQYGDHPPEVSMIKVDPEYRRHGIATALFDFARQHQGDLEHSDSRTELGRRWVNYEQSRKDVLARLAAVVGEDLLGSLHDEFHDWVKDNGGYDPYGDEHSRGPIGDWTLIEDFLFDRYPAAAKGHDLGMEEAGRILDGHEPMPYQQRADLTPYETGPEAAAKHGYDPREIAAGMLLLHNRSHPYRSDMEQGDLDRLSEIAGIRSRQQRAYERGSNTRNAMAVLPEGHEGPAEPIYDPDEAEYYKQDEDATAPEGATWYHVSPHKLKSGDVLVPGGGESPFGEEGLYDHPNMRGRKRWVWTEHDPDNVEDWLEMMFDSHLRGYATHPAYWAPKDVGKEPPLYVYRIQPHTPPQPWESTGNQGWVTGAATVLGLHMKETGPWMARERKLVRPKKKRAAQDDPFDAQQRAMSQVLHIHDYMQTGRHPQGMETVSDRAGAHHPLLTNHWAAEVMRPPRGASFGRQVQDATGHYVEALTRTASQGRPEDARALEDAHNGLHVELQHGNHIVVPRVSGFSPLPNPSDARHLAPINPRLEHGIEFPTGLRRPTTPEGMEALMQSLQARQLGYQINCQRCCLAFDARHRGLNVEARPNYWNPKHDRAGSDEQWTDDYLAGLWQDEDGFPARWIDTDDQFPLLSPSPAHWDAMTDHIASWGPGARALIGMAQRDPTKKPGDADEVFRHVVAAHVGRNGRVSFVDPQTADSAHEWRGRIMYGYYPPGIFDGDRRRKAEADLDRMGYGDLEKTTARNFLYSPLRYMRVDDKELTDEAAQHLVNRGSAGPVPILPGGRPAAGPKPSGSVFL